MHTKTFTYDGLFELESGEQLKELQIGYHTYGHLNEDKNNVVWVCHALTANSDVFDWWKGFAGEGSLINPQEHYIICANVLSSPYGTTNPLNTNPITGQPYYLDFPVCTIRDMANAHQLLANHLGIEHISLLIGGSLGGQQALEWAIQQPERIEQLILIATNAFHSPWGIALNESQRLALSADASFYENTPDGGSAGLKAARSMALLSYRGYSAYNKTQKETDETITDNYRAASYQSYQGEKLVKRFNAYSYWYLTKAMDSHHVGRNRGDAEKALAKIKARTLVIGITSDMLFPINEQQYLYSHIPNADYAEFDSIYGHDGFLIETGILTRIIFSFLNADTPIHNTELQKFSE
ncbi:homoserine O-acetyltransferase [Mucilaginibacter sp. Bleaf8]|uniref:homoserine O-acetyltransferase family protein n=1 Tax=Mucilaginibacter sp. Bleaf8 TaxID=2834430 RepID=UPI001BCB7C97|nr:homoserine O-acetyltransferase [Mucilaginibacter sp. Bleaf8]MBS7563100.1 homoserine O-acetyltransferase [Mucilaginibacter sp. Bleaf8]